MVAADLAQLRAWIAAIANSTACITLIERMARGSPCPHYRHSHLHHCGQASGLQRFRCCRCGRIFNALTGTLLARLRKRERWLAYLQCVLESRMVRDAAQRLHACLRPAPCGAGPLLSALTSPYPGLARQLRPRKPAAPN